MRSDGAGQTRLTNNAADDYAPSWSPDGSRLVFSSNRDGDYEIYSISADGGAPTKLTNNTGFDDIEPAWSPDMQKVVFSTDRRGQFELFVMNADGSAAGLLLETNPLVAARYPNWAPDGSKIVYELWTPYAGGWTNPGVFVINPNGTGFEQLSQNMGQYDELPQFSADGTKILFDSDWEDPDPADDSPEFDVYVFSNAGGDHGANLTNSPGLDIDPDWQPIPAFPLVDARFSIFNGDIVWLFNAAITKGCSAERFCPDAPVTRGQMAAFLARALDLPAASADYFSDDESSIFEGDINRLAEAGITSGCGGGKYCPEATITREQMAAYLDRALDLPATVTDFFSDDEASPFQANINRVAAAGITKGCSLTTYCPLLTVTRGQMAAFLHRAFG